MGYCFSCGRLRDTRFGFCAECNSDEKMRRSRSKGKDSHASKEDRYQKGHDFEHEGIRKRRRGLEDRF